MHAPFEATVAGLRRAALPVQTLDPSAALEDLAPLNGMVGDATVVALAPSSRTAHELTVLGHRVTRYLVEELGFRAVCLEEDWTKGMQLDEHVRFGTGELASLFADAWPPNRTQETVDLIRWVRDWNRARPDDPVRVVGIDFIAVQCSAYDAVSQYLLRHAPDRRPELEPLVKRLRPQGALDDHTRAYRSAPDQQVRLAAARRLHEVIADLPTTPDLGLVRLHASVILAYHEWHAGGTLALAEQRMAEHIIGWQQHTGSRAVYLGGMAHAVDGSARTVSSPRSVTTNANTGSRLRAHLGARYLTVGLTFDHGTLPREVPPPAADFADVVLGAVDLETYLLDLRELQNDHNVSGWLHAPAKLRLMGPDYDPAHDSASSLSNGTLVEWFDLLIHHRMVTPTKWLGPATT